jgi:hypothetical protein
MDGKTTCKQTGGYPLRNIQGEKTTIKYPNSAPSTIFDISNDTNFSLLFIRQCAIGIGAAASRFYLLFQQHANRDSTRKAGLLTSPSGKGWNTITHFGKRTLVVLPDTRSERTKQVILSDETYRYLDEQIRENITSSTRHLVVVLGTPLVYPALTLFEDSLEKMGDTLSRQGIVGKIFGKCKAFENVLGQFGPELLDDLVCCGLCNFCTFFSIYRWLGNFVSFSFVLNSQYLAPFRIVEIGRFLGLQRPH